MSESEAAPPIPQVRYPSSGPSWPNRYVWPVLVALVQSSSGPDRRIFEIGSGNGATAGLLTGLGFQVTGIDPSHEGVEIARRTCPDARFQVDTAYSDLAGRFGTFPIVVSLEVIEHCFSPEAFAKTMFDLIEPGGTGIISTPFHGYWKNLALSLTGKWDRHLDPLWEGGHIKFFSKRTLSRLLDQSGFVDIRFRHAGRIAPLAKSMVAIFRKPK